MGVFVAGIATCKYGIADENYKYVLAFFNALFLVVIYPKPIHFIALILVAYISTFLASDVFKFSKKLWGILILLIPMLLVKFDIRFGFYPFELNAVLSFAGLSYASFRIVGYYMDKSPNEKMADFVSYFNFLSFTPTLLIGPIDKFSRFHASQAIGFTAITSENFKIGWNTIVKGIAFKYVLAELIDRYWLQQIDSSSRAILPMMTTMYGYYLYLFFDFAGYSFMALGLGKLMGMEVPVNFRNPFIATNPQDFWRRFHISLGDWLKDYFFTPLYIFFSRKKNLKKYPLTRQNIALLLTFMLMGCWNGFKFHYIFSGFLFGLYSVVHNIYLTECKKKQRDVFFGNLNPGAVKAISIFVMIHLVSIALYIFSGRCPIC